MKRWKALGENNQTTAVILAAGQGRRMNAKIAKQYIAIKEKPILCYSIEAFEASKVDCIIIVVAKNEIDSCMDNIVKKYKYKKIIKLIEGGKERFDSVYKALNIVKTKHIMIHDGARPFIKSQAIDYMINYLKEKGPCIYGVLSTDTLKEVDNDNKIKNTLIRDKIWAAQTPQSFETCLLKSAYNAWFDDKNKIIATDDSSIYESYIKERVKILEGDYSNIKITTQKDLYVGEMIINSQV